MWLRNNNSKYYFGFYIIALFVGCVAGIQSNKLTSCFCLHDRFTLVLHKHSTYFFKVLVSNMGKPETNAYFSLKEFHLKLIRSCYKYWILGSKCPLFYLDAIWMNEKHLKIMFRGTQGKGKLTVCHAVPAQANCS
jgi:hypothetical protein